MKSIETMTLDEFVQVARELRVGADEAEKKFLEFLLQAEKQKSIWQDTGLSFLELLERYSICKPTRFLRYKSVVDRFGPEPLQSIGIHGILAAGSLRSPEMQRDYLDQVAQWQRANGTTISQQSAMKLSKEQNIREVASKSRHRGYLELARENEKLRNENEELRNRIGALEVQLRVDLADQVKSEMRSGSESGPEERVS